MTPRSDANDVVGGHRPGLFEGQKDAILGLLLKNHGIRVPAYILSAIALPYRASVEKLRNAGYFIENQTSRPSRQVHGSLRLVACPGEPSENL